jgi:hypothetical protein
LQASEQPEDEEDQRFVGIADADLIGVFKRAVLEGTT